MEHRMIESDIGDFRGYLYREECSAGTIEKYVRDVRNFYLWLDERNVNKEKAAGWKKHLLEKGYAPVTINSMVSAVNRSKQIFQSAGFDPDMSIVCNEKMLFRDHVICAQNKQINSMQMQIENLQKENALLKKKLSEKKDF